MNPIGENFLDILKLQLRDITYIAIINAIQDEFEKFVGIMQYQRYDDQTDSRIDIRYRDFDAQFVWMKDFAIRRARNGRLILQLNHLYTSAK